MKLEEVLPAFREGKGIKRKVWDNYFRANDSICTFFDGESDFFTPNDILANDWEVEKSKRDELKERILEYRKAMVGCITFDLAEKLQNELFEFIDTLEIKPCK